MTEAHNLGKQAIIDGLASNWNANDIQELASTLLRLADSLDQNRSPQTSTSIFRWPSAATRIEHNLYALARRARIHYNGRRRRKEFLPTEFLGEPAWDMLLDLFMQHAGGAKVSTTSLCIAADCPATTALRYITLLEQAGLVKKSASSFDKRITFVELTDQGVLAVGRYLEDHG